MLLGVTHDDGFVQHTIGLTADTFGASQAVALLRLGVNIQTARTLSGLNFPDSVFPETGSFLVMRASEVPIPGALPLFLTGLGALALIARRRKKNA
jgi:hypothetical protein